MKIFTLASFFHRSAAFNSSLCFGSFKLYGSAIDATQSGVKEYVNFYKEGYGVDNFIFRQLMDYDHKAINPEIMKYYETNKISLDDIWKDMENHKELVPYLNLLGYYYYVEIYKYNECTIASEAANLERQYKEKGNHPDTVYEMVFHTDGKLCGSWIPNEERLM